jgi:hypothetical protein
MSARAHALGTMEIAHEPKHRTRHTVTGNDRGDQHRRITELVWSELHRGTHRRAAALDPRNRVPAPLDDEDPDTEDEDAPITPSAR